MVSDKEAAPEPFSYSPLIRAAKLCTTAILPSEGSLLQSSCICYYCPCFYNSSTSIQLQYSADDGFNRIAVGHLVTYLHLEMVSEPLELFFPTLGILNFIFFQSLHCFFYFLTKTFFTCFHIVNLLFSFQPPITMSGYLALCGIALPFSFFFTSWCGKSKFRC